MTATSPADSASPAAVPADFVVDFTPEEAQLEWEWDDMHAPSPLAPLAADYALVLCSGFDHAYERFETPWRLFAKVVAGYLYMAVDYGVPDDEIKATVDRLRAAFRAFAPDNLRYWNEEALPELVEIYRRQRDVDVDGLPAPALVEAWDAAWQGTQRAWEIHFVAIRGAYRISEDLADLYEQAMPGAAPGAALTLIQGENDVLQDVEAGLEALADRIAAAPALATRVRQSPAPSLEELAELPGGREVVSEIRRFLDVHGHLGQPFDDLVHASWAEEPPLLLGDLAKRLERPPERSATRRARLRADAKQALADVRAALADRPEERDAFERVFAIAAGLGPLTETHNYWIDRMAQARVRELAVRVGARLARAGAIETAADVLFLHRDEIARLLLQPSDVRAVVDERKAELERQRGLKPPAKLGRTLPDLGVTSRFDVARQDAAAGELLKGTGASAGIARGFARIALGPQDFPRIAPGDIIVCPSSNPSWIPVFTIAAGLVTNTGGVLAHAAVVAREFGLPAVVGVTGATTSIADGRLVEIDGTAGTVRLL